MTWGEAALGMTVAEAVSGEMTPAKKQPGAPG